MLKRGQSVRQAGNRTLVGFGSGHQSKLATRSSGFFDLHFKWSPCSIKQDFLKLNSGAFIKNMNATSKSSQFSGTKSIPGAFTNASSMAPARRTYMRPRHLLNHFEGHKELTRKDELVSNLKT